MAYNSLLVKKLAHAAAAAADDDDNYNDRGDDNCSTCDSEDWREVASVYSRSRDAAFPRRSTSC